MQVPFLPYTDIVPPIDMCVSIYTINKNTDMCVHIFVKCVNRHMGTHIL